MPNGVTLMSRILQPKDGVKLTKAVSANAKEMEELCDEALRGLRRFYRHAGMDESVLPPLPDELPGKKEDT